MWTVTSHTRGVLSANSADCYLATAMTERIRNGEMRKKAVELGVMTEDEVEGMAAAWQEWAQRDDASLGMMHGEILIHK